MKKLLKTQDTHTHNFCTSFEGLSSPCQTFAVEMGKSASSFLVHRRSTVPVSDTLQASASAVRILEFEQIGDPGADLGVRNRGPFDARPGLQY